MGTCSSIGASERDHRLDGKSRMRREFHVRFREGVGVQFPRATRHSAGHDFSGSSGFRGGGWTPLDRPWHANSVTSTA
jgi:hypothetical protein